MTFDLTDPGAIVTATAEILQCFGHVDVLINNAGISYRGTIVDTTTDVDKKVMETNYFGPIALTKGNSPEVKGKRALHVGTLFTLLDFFLAKCCLTPSILPRNGCCHYSLGVCFLQAFVCICLICFSALNQDVLLRDSLFVQHHIHFLFMVFGSPGRLGTFLCLVTDTTHGERLSLERGTEPTLPSD